MHQLNNPNQVAPEVKYLFKFRTCVATEAAVKPQLLLRLSFHSSNPKMTDY